MAVTAAVLQGDRLAVSLAVEDDRLSQQRSSQETFVRKLSVPGGDVTGVALELARKVIFSHCL
jgi:hypothetical protein